MNPSDQPAALEKGYEGKEFSYTSPHDSWGKRLVIRTLELLTGRKYLQRIYDELHMDSPNPFDIWEKALNKLDISMDFDAAQLEKVPRKGPVIFIANHPFGVVDGVYLLHLVTRARRDFFLLVNEVLSHEPVMEGHLLPVDFRSNDEALQTNLQTKERTTERLRNGEALAIFPSGGVATSMKFFGEVEELPWRKFICTRIHETQCSVVPIYFYGKNSRLFQFVSKLSMNMRLGLLLHEIMNKRGKRLRAEIGDPIHYSEMEPYPDRQDLIDYLQRRTMALKRESQDHF